VIRELDATDVGPSVAAGVSFVSSLASSLPVVARPRSAYVTSGSGKGNPGTGREMDATS